MHNYDPATPRVAIAMSAVAMTALTMSLMVVAPAIIEVDQQESIVAASKVITEASASAISYSVSDYLAVHELALAVNAAECMCKPDVPEPVATSQSLSAKKKTSSVVSSSVVSTSPVSRVARGKTL
jgi:hypothetical protein